MNPLEVLQIVTERLERSGLPYMVAGSFAGSIYGEPRYTHGADIVTGLSQPGIDDIIKSFSPDFYIDRGQVERAVQSCSSFNVVHLESAFKVDLFVAGAGAFEREALKRRARKTLQAAPHYAPHI